MTHHKTVNWSCFYTCIECSFTHARFGLVYFEGLVSTAGNYWGEIGQYRFISNLKLSYPSLGHYVFPPPHSTQQKSSERVEIFSFNCVGHAYLTIHKDYPIFVPNIKKECSTNIYLHNFCCCFLLYSSLLSLLSTCVRTNWISLA